ncbi:MAG: T9SS type A sorting domain-containing protein [Candidatus Bipolaricaulota bacterium]|nr:T9SS type A sorting domain-containing protein [Candidatus Bipolaricaulota bacterium]MDW8152345.1 T9SS type A sorting domain-containing protein [Candidatus Bipolaricaulota bacterium]
MKRLGWIGAVLAAVVVGTMAWAFDAYFADAAGKKLGEVQEGRYVYIAVKDPEKGACGIDEFTADLLIFDFKTGAYIVVADDPDTPEVESAVFRELGGIGSGLYFWVAGTGSNTKVSVQVGSRDDYADVPAGMVHVLGNVTPAVTTWNDGNWEYVDEDVVAGDLPQNRTVERTRFVDVTGRLENNDTLILIVRDNTNPMNIDQDQVKIADTVARLTATPAVVSYRCPACDNIIVRIEDKDENLNPNEIEYVPFFVILNPGSWNPVETPGVNNFCSLLRWGGYDAGGTLIDAPIRWFNIYDDRFIDYDGAAWAANLSETLLRAVFFAAETGPDTGVFEFNFGNLENFQEALGLTRDDRLPIYSTITFYYLDPNDFDDMDLTAIYVNSNKYHSQTWITDANGVPVSEVKIGHGGLYIRVYDADANVNACCQDKIVVHICDPHNEDDSEYVIIDEVSNNSGIFFTQSGIRLEPVWDAVNGYQLVFDDWKVQAFNEDTIFVQYNSVDYEQEDLNALGDGNPNDDNFPPAIADSARNQYWDVSFAKVKVYDFQVFDGKTHHMRFLDGNYQPVTEISLAGNLYLEVTDLDQNENPLLREFIFGGWNKDADADDEEHSAPIWGGEDNVLGQFLDLGASSISGIPATVKVFMFNAQKGTWERLDLRETGVGTGVFRSTVCVAVGPDGLNSSGGDTIMAFYQDPSNHSDIAIISIKVSLGGAGAVTPPVVALGVAFDRTTYYPGDTVTLTVTDEQYAGAAEIVGTNVLVLLDKDGNVITSWNRLEAVPGQPGKFRVTYVLPETVKLGTITAKYTDPYVATRTAQATATVVAKALANVRGVTVAPNPFKTTTTFTIQAEPAGAVAEKITVTLYDLTGAKVAVVEGRNTASLTWNGGNLGNGAYIYVAVVEGAGKVFGPFKGFVYIER